MSDFSDVLTAGVAAAVFLTILVLSVIGYIIYAFLLMKVFEKAGVAGRWRAWVPLYNQLVFAKLGDVSPWVMLGAIVLTVIPYLNFITWVALVVVTVMAAWRVGLKLQKDWPLLLLWILQPIGQWIWLGILGFGPSRWNAAIRPAPWHRNFLADTTRWNGIPVQAGPGAAEPPYGVARG